MSQGEALRSPLLMSRERSAKLPVRSIHRVMQDSKGYIWYATVNGLCRDDGYSIKTYRNDYRHPQSVASNHVLCLAEDSVGHILIGTHKGGYYLDAATEQFTPLAGGRFEANEVSDIRVLPSGGIMMLVDGHLYRLAGVESKEAVPDTHKTYCRWFYVDGRDGSVMASFAGGDVCLYNEAKSRWVPLADGSKLGWVTDMCRGEGCVWFSTFDRGLVRMPWPYHSEPLTQAPYPIDSKGQPCSEFWRVAYSASDSLLWAFGPDDLYAFRTHADGTTQCEPVLIGFGGEQGLSATKKMIANVMIDNEHNLWVVSFDGTHFMAGSRMEEARFYPLPQLQKRYGGNVVVSAACQDPASQGTSSSLLWISQERMGLNLYDTRDGHLVCYQDFADLANLPLGWVPYIEPSHTAHHVWVITRSPVVYSICQQDQRMALACKVDVSTQGENEVTAIHEDRHGRLWIGTPHKLLLYTPDAKSLRVVNSDMPYITDFAETSDGRIWATVPQRGLCEIDGQLRCTLHPHDGNLLCVDAASNGQLWIGSDEGDLLSYTSAEGFVSWASRCELPGDMIDNVAVDAYNHVWVQMNQSLCELNPHNGAFRKFLCSDDATLSAYPSLRPLESLPIQSNNIPLRRFMPKALFLNADGGVCLGGFGGVVRMMPTQRLEGIPQHRPIVLTDVTVMRRSVLHADTAVTLPCNSQHVEFSFSTLDYVHAPSVRFACRLEGVDRDWVFLPTGSNTVLYTQLPRGHHHLEVMATDANGLWIEHHLTIDVCREPYWWESTLAFILYAVLAVGVLVTGLCLYRRRLKRQNEQLWQDSHAMQTLRSYVASERPGCSLDTDPSMKDTSNISFTQLDDALIDKARSIMQTHLGDPSFGVQSLAVEMGMSRSTLTRRFKAIVNDTPLHFITQMRMDAARTMLSGNRNVTVSEVALRVGFSDAKYFANVYKETFGILPSREKPSEN